MMFEQDSMTPPSSPLMQNGNFGNEKIVEAMLTDFSQLQEDDIINTIDNEFEPLFFSCQGECNPNNVNRDTDKQSFIYRCRLERFLQEDISHLDTAFDGSTVELFNFHFTAPTALFQEMDKLFFLLRKRISKMELLLSVVGNSASGQELLEERICIRQFFNYILMFLKSFAEFYTEKTEFVHLIKHLKDVLLHIGRLTELQPGVLAGGSSKFGNKSCSVSYHLFHLHLEIYWAVLEILYYISVKLPEHLNGITLCTHKPGHEADLIGGDLVSQTAQVILWDIVELALVTYRQAKPIELADVSPFRCTCIRELLVLIRHLLVHRQQLHAKESLLMIIQPIMLYILKCDKDNHSGEESMLIDDEVEIYLDVYQLPPDIICNNHVGFVWWFMAGFIPTFQYDICGKYSVERLDITQTLGFGYILQQLARKSIVMPEVHLRNHLRFCLRLSRSLEPNTQILSIFWDQFYKKLNDTYSLTSNPLGHLQSIKKSASDLLVMSKKIVMNDPKELPSATSFMLYLHLLCMELQKSGKKGSANQEWKSMKGRFYSKFHSRRMQELSELGLQHFSLLFLCLSEVADTQDVVQKQCDLYSTLNIAALPTRKRLSVWRGSFAVILLLVENKTDVLFLTEKMAASFNAISSELAASNMDPSRYTEILPLIDLYIESTQEVFETSDVLTLNQHKLICHGFQEVIKVCRENDLRKVLNFVEAVLTKHRILCKRELPGSSTFQIHTSQKHDLNDSLWKYFYTFVKEHSCTLTPPQKLADLAAGFMLLAFDAPPSGKSGMREDAVSCFGYFAWNENVNARISCRFLCHLLPNEEAVNHLTQKIPGFDRRLVQSWIKCSLELSPSDEDLAELTRLLLKIQCISTVFAGNSLIHQDDDPPLLHFIHTLGQNYNSLQDLKSRTECRDQVEQYFADVPKALNVLIKSCTSQEGMCNIYKIAGHMVKDCATLLYLKSKPDCLLPVLLDKLALPRAVTVQNKPIPPLMLAAMKAHLHLFVKGLGKLDYRRDPYVQRKLKDIVIHYLTKFPVESGHFHNTASSVHPLLMAINDTFPRTVTEEASNFRRYFTDLIKSEYLTLRGTALPQHASLGLNFMLDLIRRTMNGEEVAKDSVVLLKTTLDYMLIVENTELRTNAVKVMQHLVENLAKHAEVVNLSVLRTIVQKFFENNVKLYQGTKVLKVMDSIAVLFPALLIPMIKVMTNAIKASEAKRGVGLDKQLRMIYYNLLANLGDSGNEEKSNLLRTTPL